MALTMSTLSAQITDRLNEIGIYEPDPADELHIRLVDAMRRTATAGAGNQLVAIQWVLNWELGRQGRELAEAKADYELLRAQNVVRFRDGGEKSGAMCETRADALPEVREAHLRYRLAEQLERLARKRLDTISNQIEVWRTQAADQRAADSHHARTAS